MFSLTFFTRVGMSLTLQSNTDDSITLSLTMPYGTVRDSYLEEDTGGTSGIRVEMHQFAEYLPCSTVEFE